MTSKIWRSVLSLVFFLALPVLSQAQQSQSVVASAPRLPLEFEPNQGQSPHDVLWQARAASYEVLAREHDVALMLRHSKGSEPAMLSLRWVAGAPDGVGGEGRLEGISNYFRGNDPRQWHTNIPHYSRVRYHGVYPGIDWVIYGNDGRAEYDLIVAPGARLDRAVLKFDGAQKLRLDRNGDLVVRTAAGDLVQRRPDAYQFVAGHRRAVRVRYVLKGRDRIAFRADYDRRRELMIDPVLYYSTFLGGSGSDGAYGVAVDSSGYSYVVGITTSSDFPHTSGSFTGGSADDVFVTKLSPAGANVVYSTIIGGSGVDFSRGIALDSSNNAYITGGTDSTDFPHTTADVGSAYVLKLNANGSAIVYSMLFGGIAASGDGQFGKAIKVNAAGEAFVAGYSAGKSFPATAGAFQTAPSDPIGNDGFVVRINASGTGFIYATYLGGNDLDYLMGLDIDADGNAYITGDTSSTNFPTTPGAYRTTSTGAFTTSFVTKLSPDGSSLVYSTYIGPGSSNAIAVDGNRDAHITGSAGAGYPTVGLVQRSTCAPIPGQNGACYGTAVYTKLNATGTGLLYSTYFDGNGGGSTGEAIATRLDSNGNSQAYIGGETSAPDFPTTNTGFQRVLASQSDGFLVHFSNTLNWGTLVGGNRGDYITGVALKGSNVYAVGYTISSTFPVTRGAYDQRLSRDSAGHDTNDAFALEAITGCILPATDKTVTICRPTDGSTVASPVTIMAGTTTNGAKVKLLAVYVDGVQVYHASLSALYLRIGIGAGTHQLTVQATDTNNATFSKTISLTVQ